MRLWAWIHTQGYGHIENHIEYCNLVCRLWIHYTVKYPYKRTISPCWRWWMYRRLYIWETKPSPCWRWRRATKKIWSESKPLQRYPVHQGSLLTILSYLVRSNLRTIPLSSYLHIFCFTPAISIIISIFLIVTQCHIYNHQWCLSLAEALLIMLLSLTYIYLAM